MALACLGLALFAATALSQTDLLAQGGKTNGGFPEIEKMAAGPEEKLPEDESKSDEPHVRIPLGEFFKMRPASGLAIKEAFIDRDKVVKLVPFEKKATSIRAVGVGLGDARLTIVDIKDETKTYRIRVTPSLQFLQQLLDRQFPQSHLKLSALGDDAIFVEGNVDAPAHVDHVINLLETCVGKKGRVVNNIRLAGVTQVQLNICIARVDRREVRRLNSNFLAANTTNFIGNQLGNLIGVPGISIRGGKVVDGGGRVFAPSVNNGQVLSSSSTVFFGVTNDDSQIFGFIELLKQHGMVKVLANPTLVTTNGRPADFLVGGEQPVPTVIFAGGTAQPNVQFKSFGTRLTFVPVLLGDGKIRLDVQPEVSTVNFAAGINTGGVTVPQFVTQRLHTTVEMEAGQTLYLGGLLQTELEADVQKIPVLGDMPWVGAAFRKISHQHRETELVVVVTPKLVDPMRECQKPALLPGQESRNPTDYELFIKGRIEMSPQPPPLSHHHKKLHYSMPISFPTNGPTVDPMYGPTFGPFGPAPQPQGPAGEGSLNPGPVFGPFGPGAAAARQNSSPVKGLSTPGPINSPVADAVFGTVTVEQGPAPANKR